MVFTHHSTDELESQLGEDLKRIRLLQAIDRQSLAANAGVSLNTMKRLENGQGATITTLIKVLRALGRLGWLSTLSPQITVNPLNMPRDQVTRQRAPKRKKKIGV